MSTASQGKRERVEHLIDLLEQQQDLLRRAQWPRFEQVKQQADRLWDQLTREGPATDPLPMELRRRLETACHRLELIVATQKHLVAGQLRQLRQNKPMVKTYRAWSSERATRPRRSVTM